MNALRLFGALVIGFLVVLESGCGSSKSKPVAASGVLTWEDGQPVPEVTIVFLPEDPKGPKADGFTGKDGSFTLTTYNQGDGAMPGDYKIIVTKVSTPMPSVQGGDPTKLMKEHYEKSKKVEKEKGAVPVIYASPKTSPLKWRVEAGGAKISLKLKTL